MRKKSHISLAKYIVDSLEEQDLVKHKKAFYLGSILPDCKPSFLTVKHEMEGTFPKLQQDLKRLLELQRTSQINILPLSWGSYPLYCRLFYISSQSSLYWEPKGPLCI